jgi:uncharacterized membrane protein YccF (DUF307 family)
MTPLAFFLNVLWIVFGGLWMAFAWVIAAIVMAITIIGLPWARAAFNIATYTLFPFGQKAVSRAEYYGKEDVGRDPSELSATLFGFCSPAGGWRSGILSLQFSWPSLSSASPSRGHT